MKRATMKADEIHTPTATIKGLEISIGKIVDDEWEENMGPTPMPSVTDLRNWDFRLLERYKPFYGPFCDSCCLCTYGKCDLSDKKKGACGITIESQQGRIILLACLIGATAHGAHARHMVDHFLETVGDMDIDMGDNVQVEAPVTRLITGIRPRKMSDFLEILEYGEKEILHLLSATHTGQEGNVIDFESKALHASMIDQMFMEVADIAQISRYDLPKGDPDAPLVEIGLGVIDRSKPVILCFGHNALPAVGIMDYMNVKGLYDAVEVGGICCTALDMTRYEQRVKIAGHISHQIKYLKIGIADVITVDEQCIRTDVLELARETGTAVIATTDKICYGLPDRTKDDPRETVSLLLEGTIPGALILDPDVVGEVAVEVALQLHAQRRMKRFNVKKAASDCIQCKQCNKACENFIDIARGMKEAQEGESTYFSNILMKCIGCGKCLAVCPKEIDIIRVMTEAAKERIVHEKYKIRVGRGPIQDTEIRNVGQPIVMGEIPGVIAIVGCPNYEEGPEEVVEIAKTFLDRRYIVVASGCAAMDMAMWKDEEGKTLYEQYPGRFDAGCLANVGSCVSNAHIAGAAIKIASIFAHRDLRANYEEIADYILNRVGAVGIAWGAYSQKAASIATGVNRLGIPVIVGARGAKYRRMYLGRKDVPEDWVVYNARDGSKVQVGPGPEHLIYASESKEEAIVTAAKLCIRPNDTSKGRQIKLAHYIDLYKRYFGDYPDDIHLYIRTRSDIPITEKDAIEGILKEKKWKEKPIPDPTLLERLVRRR
ncbi:MAG: CO dehydrogenase/acetyl-CoA synthase complex subunit epsilon [Theionarchaea archaeon]|nr:CO dehydrogenase/acetyl-CoA synthase complex subunit epsilon [Theionarchaea archaeon]